MHFTEKAHRWKQGYLIDKPDISWEELTEALYKRYDCTSIRKLVREFNKLVHTSTVEKYQERFEDLRARMLYLNPTLSEEHFIQSYISGLKEELVPLIDISNPTTLEEVYEQAKLHEQALAIMWRRTRMISKPSGVQHQGYNTPRAAAQGHSSRPTEKRIVNQIPLATEY